MFLFLYIVWLFTWINFAKMWCERLLLVLKSLLRIFLYNTCSSFLTCSLPYCIYAAVLKKPAWRLKSLSWAQMKLGTCFSSRLMNKRACNNEFLIFCYLGLDLSSSSGLAVRSCLPRFYNTELLSIVYIKYTIMLLQASFTVWGVMGLRTTEPILRL